MGAERDSYRCTTLKTLRTWWFRAGCLPIHHALPATIQAWCERSYSSQLLSHSNLSHLIPLDTSLQIVAGTVLVGYLPYFMKPHSPHLGLLQFGWDMLRQTHSQALLWLLILSWRWWLWAGKIEADKKKSSSEERKEKNM